MYVQRLPEKRKRWNCSPSWSSLSLRKRKSKIKEEYRNSFTVIVFVATLATRCPVKDGIRSWILRPHYQLPKNNFKYYMQSSFLSLLFYRGSKTAISIRYLWFYIQQAVCRNQVNHRSIIVEVMLIMITEEDTEIWIFFHFHGKTSFTNISDSSTTHRSSSLRSYAFFYFFLFLTSNFFRFFLFSVFSWEFYKEIRRVISSIKPHPPCRLILRFLHKSLFIGLVARRITWGTRQIRRMWIWNH